jgi:hypothetical protein
MGESMKKGIATLLALFLLAFAVNGFAMGGGEQQAPEQQPGVEERTGEQETWDQQQQPEGTWDQQQQQQPEGTWDQQQQQQQDQTWDQQQQQDQTWDQQQQGQQTFTGTVDRAGDNYILIVNGTAYELEYQDEDMVENMVGQQVEVTGSLDGQTIEAESINPAGQGMQ